MTTDKHDPSASVEVELPEADNQPIIIATDIGLGKWPTRKERMAIIERHRNFI